MSEEEKEAILHFKKYENKLVYEINEKDKRYAKTILNYIDKLQEENASLKKEIKLMKSVNINDNFISKETIKKEIEELKFKQSFADDLQYDYYENKIETLEKLLGGDE